MSSKKQNAGTTRGRPFGAGNSGRPRGSRHKASIAAELLLEGEADALTRKAVEVALTGDTTALRLCLERLVPIRKDRPVQFTVGAIDSPQAALAVVGQVVVAMGAGDLTPMEAQSVMSVVETYTRVWTATDLEERLSALRERAKP